MPNPLRLLQRALISLRFARLFYFDSAYRNAMLWTRRGFRLSAAELEALQIQRLRVLIEGFRRIGLCIEAHCDPAQLNTRDDLRRIPLLTREGMQELWPRLLEVHRNRRTSELSTTGSTGIPVRVLRDASVERANEGCYIELSKMTGYRPGMMQLVIWSNNDAIGLPTAHFGRLSRLLNPRMVFRSLKSDPDEYRRLHSAIMAHRGCCLSGYTGMLALYARQMEGAGLSVPAGQVACLSGGAEMMTQRDRADLERVFKVRAHDMYGSREVHQVCWDCEYGVNHINPRLIPEVVSPATGQPLPEGQIGLLVFTDLFNTVTPLIRYRIGDHGAIRRINDCPCGRSGWQLCELQGRDSDYVRLPDGSFITPMIINPVLYLYPQITNYQLRRLGPASFSIRYLGEPLTEEQHIEIHARLVKTFAGSELVLEHTSDLPLGPGGKLRYYVDEYGEPDSQQ